MKFVAHDATIAHDFMANKGLYIESLQKVINDPKTTHDNQSMAGEFLINLTNERILIDLYFLGAITRN